MFKFSPTLELRHAIVVIMFSLYMDCVLGGYSLMGCIKDISTLKGDSYIEWRRKFDLTFILGEVDWVVIALCPTEPEATVRGADEADAAWHT
jgi:hypothetical protein